MLMNLPHPAAETSLSALRSRWRDHEEFIATRTADIRLGIAASFTANNLVPFIGTGLLDRGFVPAIRLAPYDHVFQACADPRSHFGKDSNCALLLWRIEDLMGDELALFGRGQAEAITSALAKLDQLADAVLRMRGIYQGTMMLGLPPFPTHCPSGLSGLNGDASPMVFHAAMVRRLRERLTAGSGIHLLDLDSIQANFGVAASLDWRQWYLYRQPFQEKFLAEAAGKIVRMIAASRNAPKKCIVLDADNTLWGGVVGEDGLDGIAIGDEFPGSAYRDFQRFLLHLRSQGIFLALASKNNEADVWQVFDRHDGMILGRDHISASAINWRPKAEAIPAIAKTLGIGADTLVFIDDNPMEIAQMRRAWPEVTSIQLPDEPAEILPFVQNLTCFDSLDRTEEDRQRADMMLAEEARKGLANLAQGEFQRTLELRIRMEPAEDHELGRVAQLINKTNQFNLTTIRRTLDEVRALSRSAHHRLYTLKIQDRFGDYGLTGVVIIDRHDETIWAVDTLLLSCRVLGRGVEGALLALLAQDAGREAVIAVRARFVPTEKNAPAAGFLADHGFQHLADDDWRIAVADMPMLDASIQRVRCA